MWIIFAFGFLYLATANVLTFLLYWYDKECAQEGTWRIPERRLLLAASVGGSIGGALAQRVFHHKTRKASFQNAFWSIVTIQAAAVITAAVIFLD